MTIDRSLVVDMDSHVLEPPDLWQNYLEPKYRDRAIRIERDADGDEVLIVDKKVLLKGRLAAVQCCASRFWSDVPVAKNSAAWLS